MSNDGSEREIPKTKAVGPKPKAAGKTAGSGRRPAKKAKKEKTGPPEFRERLVCLSCQKTLPVDWNSPQKPICPSCGGSPEHLRWECAIHPSSQRPYQEPICPKCSVDLARRRDHVAALGWFEPKAKSGEQTELLLAPDSNSAPGAEISQAAKTAPKTKPKNPGAKALKPEKTGPPLNKDPVERTSAKKTVVPADRQEDASPPGKTVRKTVRKTQLPVYTPGQVARGLAHVMARCPACGFEDPAYLDAYRTRSDGAIPTEQPSACPVCTTPMLWWCARHSPTIQWLYEPVCPECAKAARSDRHEKAGYGSSPDYQAVLDSPGNMPRNPGVGLYVDTNIFPPGEDPVVLSHGSGVTGGKGTFDRFHLSGPTEPSLTRWKRWWIEGQIPGIITTLLLAASPGVALVHGELSLLMSLPTLAVGPLVLGSLGLLGTRLGLGLACGTSGLALWIFWTQGSFLAGPLALTTVIALLAKDKTIPALALAVMFSITLTLDLIPVESFTQDEEASRQLQQLGETFQSNR